MKRFWEKTKTIDVNRFWGKAKNIDFVKWIAVLASVATVGQWLLGEGYLNRRATNNASTVASSTYPLRSTLSAQGDDFLDKDPQQNEIHMKLIPAGIFLMGADAQSSMEECQKYRNDCNISFFTDEEPETFVYLDAFYIDKYEVTNYLYASCVNAKVCAPPSEVVSNPLQNNYPVVQVNWDMAKAYCSWRGARLPSEAQWEKAARGTSTSPPIFPWGEEIDCTKANYWDWITGKHCVGHPTIVGQYPTGVSPYGVYDMAGNVWEWTSSLYKPYPYNSNDKREDLQEKGDRVLRGGGWLYYYYGLPRTTERFHLAPGSGTDGSDIGFRCVHLLP